MKAVDRTTATRTKIHFCCWQTEKHPHGLISAPTFLLTTDRKLKTRFHLFLLLRIYSHHIVRHSCFGDTGLISLKPVKFNYNQKANERRRESTEHSEMTEGEDKLEGVWDRIWEGGEVRDRDWAQHQMKHERGRGEAENQYILINSQSSLCKSCKIPSRLADGSIRPTPAAAMFSLLSLLTHSTQCTNKILPSAHTQRFQFISSLEQIAFLCTWDCGHCHSFGVDWFKAVCSL